MNLSSYLKRWLFTFTFLTILSPCLLGQNLTSKYSMVLKYNSGRVATGKNVDLYQNGVKKYDLSEDPSTPGTYYNDTVAAGEYDIYVGGTLYKSGIYIGANKLSIVANKFDDNGNLAGDGITALVDSLTLKIGTNQLKLSSVDGPRIANKAISGSKVADYTLEDRNYGDSSIPDRALKTGLSGSKISEWTTPRLLEKSCMRSMRSSRIREAER